MYVGDYKGLTRTELKREKAHLKWRMQMAKNALYVYENQIIHSDNKNAEVVKENRRARNKALEDYIAGRITEEEYRKLKIRRPPKELTVDQERRYQEVEDFIMRQQQDIKKINFLLANKGYDPTQPSGKLNQKKPGYPKGRPHEAFKHKENRGDPKPGEVRNPWGRMGKPKEIKEAEEKARIEKEQNSQYWKRYEDTLTIIDESDLE